MTARPARLKLVFGEAAGAAILADIAAGTLDVSGINSDGVLRASDVVFRASLDWKVNDDIMLFTTFSQGFRPPTTNRNAAQAARNPSGLTTFRQIPGALSCGYR